MKKPEFPPHLKDTAKILETEMLVVGYFKAFSLLSDAMGSYRVPCGQLKEKVDVVIEAVSTFHAALADLAKAMLTYCAAVYIPTEVGELWQDPQELPEPPY